MLTNNILYVCKVNFNNQKAMAKKKLKRDTKSGLVIRRLDFEEVKRQYALIKGKTLTKELFSKETGLTMVTLKKYEKELPPPITFINYLMTELNMDFEQLTKEVYE